MKFSESLEVLEKARKLVPTDEERELMHLKIELASLYAFYEAETDPNLKATFVEEIKEVLDKMEEG